MGALLGSGSFAVVHSCTRRSDGRPFAVKVMDTTDWSERDVQDLYREAENLRALDHPNIVKMIELVREEDVFYLVTEKASGGELVNRIIEREHYTEGDAREVVRLILRALGYCHDQGVVHRDVKLQNVMLADASSDAAIKLVDFGFSAKLDTVSTDRGSTSRMLSTPCGTLRFCAPEILLNERYGPKVDVWGVGCIMYALLCGYPPFYDENDAALMRKIVDCRYDFDGSPWAHVSDTAKDAVRRMLTTEPALRPTCDEMLLHEWFSQDDIAGSNCMSGGLRDSLKNLRSYNTRRKFRAAVKVVVAMHRIRSMSSARPSEAQRAASAQNAALDHARAMEDEHAHDAAKAAKAENDTQKKVRRMSKEFGLTIAQAQDVHVVTEQVGVTPERAVEAYRASNDDLTDTVLNLVDTGEMAPEALARTERASSSKREAPQRLSMTTGGKAHAPCEAWRNGRVGVVVDKKSRPPASGSSVVHVNSYPRGDVRYLTVSSSDCSVGQLIANAFPPKNYPPGAPGTPMCPSLDGMLIDEHRPLHEVGIAPESVIVLYTTHSNDDLSQAGASKVAGTGSRAEVRRTSGSRADKYSPASAGIGGEAPPPLSTPVVVGSK